MYYGLIEGNKIPTERLEWVKSQYNGVYVHCAEHEGEGIILYGKIYHVDGRPEIDKPTIILTWEDDIGKLMEENQFLKECIMELSEQIYGG